MKLADLLALAEKATPADIISMRVLEDACSPEVVAALVRCVMAQDAYSDAEDWRAAGLITQVRAELDRVLGAEK